MKKMRKIALPLAIFALGIGSAYATTASGKTESNIEAGFRFDPMAPPAEQCQETLNQCTIVSSDQVCTYFDGSAEQNLYQDGCVQVLYKI
ncbi:hypothetical protein AB670_03431 [Chryseobacterium sp. MOF25P]|uniref:DUF6520 family protein n=2 Tax=Chryseobacterium TaxID=59732 RepID=UPI000805098A|nr:hypothetical protein AB670_03431 [Chryseobacterium sp. MOF25P]OBW44195.1 hypothetical protein AB671_03724 [Chryseobacterium sp. BGARF1]